MASSQKEEEKIVLREEGGFRGGLDKDKGRDQGDIQIPG